MTPKKDIVRRPVYTLDDGSPVPSMGKEFTYKESTFIFWYSYPGTEAFMNAGRAAVRAGYKGNAVMQGYLLRQKPRIAEKINSLLIPAQERLRGEVWRIAFFCHDRMFFDIRDFYRDCKRTVKIQGKETEVNSVEIIPLGEISERNRMCIDNIDFKGPQNIPVYKLPDREKNAELFFKCAEIILGKSKTEIIADAITGNRDILHNEDMNYKKIAEIIREDIRPLLIAP